MCGLESAKFLLSVHDQGCHGELSFLGGCRNEIFYASQGFFKLAGPCLAREAFSIQINTQVFQLNTKGQ